MMYTNFATVYDRLMRDVPYAAWIEYLGRLFARHGMAPQNVIDIGCGTGNVTIPLAEMGYRLTGLDLSEEMLAVAEEKARSKGLRINWLKQDMRQADLGRARFDLAISMTDSLNYIENPLDLAGVFARVCNLLEPDGWFIFDLNSLYKVSEVFGNNIFTLSDDDIAYIWENEFDSANRTCTMDLTFFVREQDGRYRRFTENHHETGYPVDEVCRMLAETGFDVRGVYAENTFDQPVEDTERIYFVAKKMV